MKKLFLLFCASIATVPSFCSSTNIDQAFESSSLQEQMQPNEQLLSQNQQTSLLQGKARLFIAPLVAGVINMIIAFAGTYLGSKEYKTSALICLLCYFAVPITGIITYFLFCYKVKAGFGVKFFRCLCISLASVVLASLGFAITCIIGFKAVGGDEAPDWAVKKGYGTVHSFIALLVGMIFIPIFTHYLFGVSYPSKSIDSASEESTESLALKEAS